MEAGTIDRPQMLAIFGFMNQNEAPLPEPTLRDYASCMAPDLVTRLGQYRSDEEEDQLVAQAAHEMTAGDLAALAEGDCKPFPLKVGIARALAYRFEEHPEEGPRCLEYLAKMAENPDAGVRTAVLNALVSLELTPAIRQVLNRLTRDLNSAVRREALQALD